MIYTKKWGDNVKQYLYNKGDEFTAFTGGWTTSIYAWNNSYGTGLKPTLTKGSDSIRGYLSATGVARSGSIFPINPIAVDNYTKLCVQFRNMSPTPSYGTGYACLMTSNPASANYASPNVVYAATKAGVGFAISVFDISALTGNYYLALSMIAFYVNSTNYSADVYIDKVWLE